MKQYIGTLGKNEQIVVENNKVYLVVRCDVEKWIDDVIKKYVNDKSVCCTMLRNDRNAKIGVIVYTKESNKCAMSKCHPNDTFSIGKGTAIAYARLKGIDIPSEVLE